MTKLVKFHDPHDGFSGAGCQMPAPIHAFCVSLAGQTRDLDEVIAELALMASAEPGGVVIDQGDFISLRVGQMEHGVLVYGHSWRAIRYKPT